MKIIYLLILAFVLANDTIVEVVIIIKNIYNKYKSIKIARNNFVKKKIIVNYS